MWAWLLLGLVAPAAAQEQAGEFVLERGKAIVRHLGEARTVDTVGARVPVFVGDVVRTAKESRGKVFFRGKEEQISLYGNTHFKVQEFTRERSSFGLSIGKALFGVFAKFRAGAFKVRTPTATIGIKGTEFVVGTDGR